jgi:beta-lactamase superfamily II metal-dependent hydrolase
MAKTSSTPLFLNHFKLEITVIQVGADNSYVHPTLQTLKRLKEAGVRVFRNDENGDVVVTIQDGNRRRRDHEGRLEAPRRRRIVRRSHEVYT